MCCICTCAYHCIQTYWRISTKSGRKTCYGVETPGTNWVCCLTAMADAPVLVRGGYFAFPAPAHSSTHIPTLLLVVFPDTVFLKAWLTFPWKADIVVYFPPSARMTLTSSWLQNWVLWQTDEDKTFQRASVLSRRMALVVILTCS